MPRRINPDTVEPLGDNYSQVVVADGPQVHISGTLPVDESHELVGEDMRTQTEQVVSNLDDSLEAVDASVEDLVRVRIFTRDAEEYLANCHEVLIDWYDGNKPASTMCEIGALADDDFLVEVDALAVLSE